MVADQQLGGFWRDRGRLEVGGERGGGGGECCRCRSAAGKFPATSLKNKLKKNKKKPRRVHRTRGIRVFLFTSALFASAAGLCFFSFLRSPPPLFPLRTSSCWSATTAFPPRSPPFPPPLLFLCPSENFPAADLPSTLFSCVSFDGRDAGALAESIWLSASAFQQVHWEEEDQECSPVSPSASEPVRGSTSWVYRCEICKCGHGQKHM